MTSSSLPPSLSQVKHHLKTAEDHDNRDPVVAYYSRMYAMNTAIKLDSKSPEAKSFLLGLMDRLEKAKKSMGDREEVTHEVVGAAYIEEYAIKLFNWADTRDRAGQFNKAVVKSFYSSALIFDILSVFDDIPAEAEEKRKYARFKAAYIHGCLSRGETPHAGPLDAEGNPISGPEVGFVGGSMGQIGPGQSGLGPGASGLGPGSSGLGPGASGLGPGASSSGTSSQVPPAPSTGRGVPQPSVEQPEPPSTCLNGAPLTAALSEAAQKYCMYCKSALEYDDVPTAVDYLRKALNILEQGRE